MERRNEQGPHFISLFTALVSLVTAGGTTDIITHREGARVPGRFNNSRDIHSNNKKNFDTVQYRYSKQYCTGSSQEVRRIQNGQNHNFFG